MKRIVSMTVLALVVALAGCGDAPKKDAAGDAGAKSTAKAPAEIFLKEKPANARDVGEVKKDAKEGDEVVIRGRIGGSKEISNLFTPNRAQILIASANHPDMKHCAEMEGDSCPTPWDYCCIDKEIITANTATVQVLDKDGTLAKYGLEGAEGMAPMTLVVVKGKVGKRPDPKTLVVNASGIYVEKIWKGEMKKDGAWDVEKSK